MGLADADFSPMQEAVYKSFKPTHCAAVLTATTHSTFAHTHFLAARCAPPPTIMQPRRMSKEGCNLALGGGILYFRDDLMGALEC